MISRKNYFQSLDKWEDLKRRSRLKGMDWDPRYWRFLAEKPCGFCFEHKGKCSECEMEGHCGGTLQEGLAAAKRKNRDGCESCADSMIAAIERIGRQAKKARQG